MIVIDASSLSKYVLHEEGWEEIGMFLKERKPLYSIDHILKEVGNAIWKYCFLKKIISQSYALKLYNALVKLIQTEVIVLEPEINYIKEALELALTHGITLYDSLYLAQAQKYGEILTSDTKQAEIAIKLGIRVHLIK